MADQTLPATLPTGTRYTIRGVEIELLGPSTRRPDGTYTVPARSYSGHVSPAPVESPCFWQSLDLCGAVVTLPDVPKVDLYAEHRKRIGDDK